MDCCIPTSPEEHFEFHKREPSAQLMEISSAKEARTHTLARCNKCCHYTWPRCSSAGGATGAFCTLGADGAGALSKSKLKSSVPQAARKH
eukprot:2109443-Amphidinium_carterae.1